MELKLTTASGKASTKSVEVSDINFSCEFNEPLVHQVVTAVSGPCPQWNCGAEESCTGQWRWCEALAAEGDWSCPRRNVTGSDLACRWCYVRRPSA